MKSTKKALTLSVLSLVLCFTMLLGTTYAWFTDSVTSGVNQIVAGNLDIELEYTTDGTTWTPVTENTKLFNESALWEPGHTEVAYLRISNVGTLALKYKFAINVGSEVAGTNVAGETFKLSNYIKMGVVDSWSGSVYADRDAARAAVTSADNIETYNSFGEMAKGAAAKTFAVVVFMPEDVGNEANYKTGTTAPSIELGVKLEAYQNTVEKDSFDELYDKLAFYTKEENGTYTDPETGKSFITEDSELVEVKPADEEVEGLFVPAEAEAGDVEKQYATTSAAVQAAIANIQNETATEETSYNIALINEEYENVELTFSRQQQGNNKDITVSSPTRTTIKKSGGAAITINSDSHYYDGEIVIENIDFELSGGAVAIKFGNKDGDDATRYPNNITVKNCTLTCTDGTDADAVLISGPTSGSKNISIIGCTLNGGHSFFSGAAVNLLVEDCVANGSWHAINNTSNGTTVIDCDFDCKGYVIRADHGPVIITDTTMKTAALNDENMEVQQDKTALVLRIPTTDALESNKVTLNNVTITVPAGIAEIYSAKGISKAYVVGAPEGTQFAGFAAD